MKIAKHIEDIEMISYLDLLFEADLDFLSAALSLDLDLEK